MAEPTTLFDFRMRLGIASQQLEQCYSVSAFLVGKPDIYAALITELAAIGKELEALVEEGIRDRDREPEPEVPPAELLSVAHNRILAVREELVDET